VAGKKLSDLLQKTGHEGGGGGGRDLADSENISTEGSQSFHACEEYK
jgi:hypothetical protein